jgi:spermidine synthase
METVQTVARRASSRGEVVLRRRTGGGRSVEELIINGAFAMDSSETSTEQRLAELALPTGRAQRVLIGGLGLGYTVNAVSAKDVATIDVVEIEKCLIDWAYQGVTATLAAAASDPRVRLYATDIRPVLAGEADEPVGPWDAIVLDVDNGPDFLIHCENRDLYTLAGLSAAYAQLTAGGSLAVWCQHPSPQLFALLEGIASSAQEHVIDTWRGARSFPHTIYTITRLPHSHAGAK